MSHSIPNDFAAAQVHNRCQISPSFLLHMDIRDVCTPFLMDGIRVKTALEDIYFTVWYGAMAGMALIFFYHYGTKPLFCHMSLHPFYAAGCSAVIKDTAYFYNPILVLVYKCGQEKLNNLYYQMKEQRR